MGGMSRQAGQVSSYQSSMKSMKAHQLPNDLGFLPGTIVRPPFSSLPSIFTSPIQRLRIEWQTLSQRVVSFVALVYMNKFWYKKDPLTGKKPRYPLLLKERYALARTLQTQLYTSVAAQDSQGLQRVACDGLRKQLQARIDHRRTAHAEKEEWEVQYRGIVPPQGLWWALQVLIPFKAVTIKADRMAPVPLGAESVVRQVVVRVKSRQRTRKDQEWKKVDEYFVLQKFKIGENLGEWMVWGTTKPTTVAEFDKMAKTGKGRLGLMDRIRSMAGGV